MNITDQAAASLRRLPRRGKSLRHLFAGCLVATGLAISLLPAPRAAAQSVDAFSSDAEKLRRLDIMLMVTGLRCRTTADNFTDDYGRFTANHLVELNQAAKELQAQLSIRYGGSEAARELDRMSVTMANQYGGGHPWLSCAELKQVTKSLAMVQGRATLTEAAGQLLDRQPRPLLALAAH